MALQDEIAALQDELTRQQDPGRMQLIQEMISVRLLSCYVHTVTTQMNNLVVETCAGSTRPDVSYQREGHGVRGHRPKYH